MQNRTWFVERRRREQEGARWAFEGGQASLLKVPCCCCPGQPASESLSPTSWLRPFSSLHLDLVAPSRSSRARGSSLEPLSKSEYSTRLDGALLSWETL